GHGHHAVRAGCAHAGDVDLELAGHGAHRGHRLDPACAAGLFGVHGVGGPHGTDNGAGVLASLALGPGFAIVLDRAALVGGDHAVVRGRILAPHTLVAAATTMAVAVAGVLAFGALRHRGVDLELGQHLAGDDHVAGGTGQLEHL